MNTYDKGRTFNILSGENDLTEEDIAWMDRIKTPYDTQAQISSGLSQMTGGNPWSIASGLSTIMNNPDNNNGKALAGRFGDLGSIAQGDAFNKASTMSSMTGNSNLAGTFSSIGKMNKDPKKTVIDTGTQALNVTGPLGMIIGTGVNKIAGAALGTGAPSYDVEKNQQIAERNKALYEDQQQNRFANTNNNFFKGRMA